MKNQVNQKTTIISLLMSLFLIQFCISQNLVENPSFEQGTPPNNQGELHRATYWTHYKGECIAYNPNIQSTFPSSDLFDKNSSSAQIGVPNNKFTTSAGLAERTGKNRYAGIYTAIYPPSPASEERIRGTLKNVLQAGGYDLSLYLARAKNFYALSNPQLDPVNYYNVEVVLRKGNSCIQSKIIYTSPSITNFQWQKYSTIFSISQSEANIYDKVEIRLKMWPIEKMGNNNARAILVDDVSISKVVCNLNAAFTNNLTCNEKSNTVSINVNNTGTNPNGTAHMYEISEMNSLSIADADVVSVVGYVYAASGTYNVPKIAGKYYMIKHGVWTSICTWKEQRKVIQIPYSFNQMVDSGFNGYINSSSNGSLTIDVNAAVHTNVVSNWIVFKNTVNTYPSLTTWSLHTWVSSNTPTHAYNVPNVQNGMFYLVRHISRTNCSQISYTDKVFYVFMNEEMLSKKESKFSYKLVSEKQYFVSKINHEKNMSQIKNMKNEINEVNYIKLYPNPSVEEVFVKSNISLKGAKIEIADKYGEVIYHGIWSKDTSIKINTLKSGVYIVTVRTLKETFYDKLLIE
ncbi:T9SS type A sorting domain-containing protein [Tenacibaculum sp. 190524A02b]|uniref:T9SS type A sorting domain-containing protein n=1 Tax=Tenacibaculum vairaonense TaxID=3137860 RepID=UPI0031FBA1C3